jgi:hypothetical protein
MGTVMKEAPSLPDLIFRSKKLLERPDAPTCCPWRPRHTLLPGCVLMSFSVLKLLPAEKGSILPGWWRSGRNRRQAGDVFQSDRCQRSMEGIGLNA